MERKERRRDQFRLAYVEYNECHSEHLDHDWAHVRMRLNRIETISGPGGTCVLLDAVKTFHCDLKHSNGKR